MNAYYKAIADAALKSGLIKFAVAPAPRQPEKLPSEKENDERPHTMTVVRSRRRAAGLNTATGQPLVRRKHPELPKGNPKLYHQLYDRKRREEQQKQSTQKENQ